MATATAELTAGYSVRLTTDDPGPGNWWRATFSGGRDVALGAARTTVDRWPPLNTALNYYWVSAAGVLEAPPVTVVSDRPLLSSTVFSGVVQVTVVSQPPLRWEAASVVHNIIGREDPVVSVLPARYPAGTLRLYLPDAAARANVLSLLRPGDPLVLRSTCRDAVEDMTFLPLRWSDPLVSESKKNGARWLDIDYQAVTSLPEYPDTPQWAWEDVEAAFASWADVEAAYPDWAGLENGP